MVFPATDTKTKPNDARRVEWTSLPELRETYRLVIELIGPAHNSMSEKLQHV
ncbi:unnamed protein product, partial [Heterotrigona itama]